MDAWPVPPGVLRLDAGEIHVWQVDLESVGAADRGLPGLLSEDERARAGRFAFEVHRQRFAAARGSLRRVLSRYLGMAPQDIAFGYGPRGKPYLAHDRATPPLRFNVSHSAERALFAVALGRELGVDLERVSETTSVLELAERFFAPQEWRFLRGLPPAARREAFFRLWTLKEAYLKASGVGLYEPLDSIVLRLAEGAAPPLVLHAGRRDWSLKELRPAADFAAAVAAEGEGGTLRCWSWTGSQGAGPAD